jgi:hypothetical protein
MRRRTRREKLQEISFEVKETVVYRKILVGYDTTDREVLLGSVSTTLVRGAPCPLIVTPRGMHERDEGPHQAQEVATTS